jgi:hypothetical protein
MARPGNQIGLYLMQKQKSQPLGDSGVFTVERIMVNANANDQQDGHYPKHRL